MKRITFALLISVIALSLGGCAHEPASAQSLPAGTTVWSIDNTTSVGGTKPEVLGTPLAENAPSGKTLVFDGQRDGLILPANAIAGWKAFTIEVLFKPAADGAEAQRFFHIEDSNNARRALMEIRLNKNGQWSLDTFLLDGSNSKALNDPARLHPAGQWHWVALRYDGQHLASFVNGAPELEGEVAFAPMLAGQTSVGVRLNKVYWFKGAIATVRFTPDALPAAQLQRLK